MRNISRNGFFDIISINLFVIFIITKLTGNYLPISLSVITFLAFIAAINFGFLINEAIFPKSGIIIILFLFLFYIYSSILWSRAPSYGITKLSYLTVTLAIGYFIRQRIVKQIDLFCKIFAFYFICSIVYYSFNYGFNNIDLINKFYRFRFTDEANPISIAFYLGFGILNILYIIKFIKISLVFKSLIYIILLLSFVLLFLTGSKGPLLSLFFSLMIPYLISNRFKVIFSVLIVGFILFIFSFNFIYSDLFFSGDITDFISRRFISDEETQSISSRMSYISLGLITYRDSNYFNLIFGFGAGDYGYLVTNSDIRMYPHNIFLEILYEFGLVGLGIFIFILVKIFQFNWRYSKLITLNLNYIVVLFYYALFVSLTTGDISDNFLLFMFLIFIFEMKNRIEVFFANN